jgi:flagellin
MSDVTLSAAVRGSLLSLQNTTNLVERTQGRLSTGLSVASAIDDPVLFFQAKSLSDRAFDFSEKKDGIDQGVSTVSAAVNGLEGIEEIVRQLKGIANSMKSATGTQFTDLVTQYATVRTQIGELANDTTYQGVSLIDNTTQSLSVSFSDQTSATLTISASMSGETGLGIDLVAAFTVGSETTFTFDERTAASIGSETTNLITVTYAGTGGLAVSDTTGISVQYGTLAMTVFATDSSTTTDDVSTLTFGQILTIDAISAGGTGVGTTDFSVITATQALTTDAAYAQTNFVTEGDTATIDPIITELDAALVTLRSQTQTLGSNVALLQTRLDFTQDYVNTLDSGASKLTLADLNEEGANLLALQTRQQLGISALAFAGQAEQGILGLFR